jgi:hypothetical protein
VSGDEDYLRSLLSRPWAPGATGKGVVLADGSLRTWPTDDGGNVHHFPALALLGIEPGAVAAYLAMDPDGVVTVWTLSAVADADALVNGALAADARLHRASDDEWDFGAS